MKKKLYTLVVVCLAALAAVALYHGEGRSAVSRDPVARKSDDGAARLRALEAYGKIPLTFEENTGQTDARVKFLARGGGYTVFLTDRDATLRLERPSSEPGSRAETGAVVRLSLAGANSHPVVHAVDSQAAHANYFVGNDPQKWRRDVPEYARVKFEAVHPGIDLVYYGSQGRLESDYIVRPGANPKRIALRVEGAERMRLNSDGDAIFSTAAGDVSLHRPRAYQESATGRVEVAANYVSLASGALGIRVGAHDTKLPLIIDPVVGYSTLLSGSTSSTAGAAIAVDSTGNAYIVGSTGASDFPTTASAFQKAKTGTTGNAFVTKLNAAGTALVFSTYLGGSGVSGKLDAATGVAVDARGDVYITGSTPSTDFPITSGSAYQVVNNGTPTNGFFTKLDPTGSTLLYSTYLGGSGSDGGTAIAIDSNGNAYITGSATSTNFPVTPGTAIQSAGASTGLAFIARFNPTLSGTGSLVYSTLLGGTNGNVGTGIAVDASSNAYITGQTASTDFPVTTGAFQSTLKGMDGNAFVARVDTTTANNLVYSTYFGGTTAGSGGGDIGMAIALGPSSNVFITGNTRASDFPVTSGVLQATPKNTDKTTFVSRIDTTKTGAAALVYSTYLGGSSLDAAAAIAVDASGNAYVAGNTLSPDFPTLPGAPQFARTTQNKLLGYVSVLNPTGTALSFSTYYGGSLADNGVTAIGLDSATPPNIYIGGGTTSSDFPVTAGAFQTTFKADAAFVAKLSPAAVTGVILAPSTVKFGSQGVNTTSNAQLVTLQNSTAGTVGNIAVSIVGTDKSSFTQTNNCGATLGAGASCTISVTFTPTATGAATATLSVADSDPSTPQTAALIGTGTTGTGDFSIAAAPTSVSVAAGGTATSTVTVTGLNGFTSAVALTCAGAPAGSTCSLNPSSVTPTSTGATSTVTFTTTARSSAMAFRIRSPRAPGIWNTALGLITLSLALFVWMIRRIGVARKVAWTFAALLMLSLTSCSGLPKTGTPAGTYTITITGTSGTLTHSTTVSLTVS